MVARATARWPPPRLRRQFSPPSTRLLNAQFHLAMAMALFHVGRCLVRLFSVLLLLLVFLFGFLWVIFSGCCSDPLRSCDSELLITAVNGYGGVTHHRFNRIITVNSCHKSSYRNVFFPGNHSSKFFGRKTQPTFFQEPQKPKERKKERKKQKKNPIMIHMGCFVS